MINTSKMPWLRKDYTVREEEQDRIEKRWEDFSIAEIEKEYKQNSETQMPWSKAVRIIQTLVDEREDYGEGNKIIKQAWARILQERKLIMRKEFFKVKGRRAGLDRSPFEVMLSRESVLYAVRNNDGSLYALIDGPLGEVNLTPLTYTQDGEERELFFEWLTGGVPPE